MALHRFVFLLLVPVFSLLPAAQFVQQGGKLVGAGSVGSAFQGVAVAVSADGNTAIVGGDFDSLGAGAAWVYVRVNGVWTQQGPKLVGTGAVGNAGQGDAVALSADGATALVGGGNDNGGVGAAWVYVRTNGVWTQQGNKLTGADATPGIAYQGRSVALSADGNTAILGGPADNGTMGAVWVYARNNRIWSQQGGKLTGTGVVGVTANQGISVSLSADGNTVIVGGATDNNYRGAAWIYSRTNGVWSQTGGKLTAGDAAEASQQGDSVAISADGNTAMVSGSGGRVGGVWVYVRTGGAWFPQGGRLIDAAATGEAFHNFAVSLSADGNTAIVGVPADSSSGGSAWIYSRASGPWTRQGAKLAGTNAVGYANQGISVALSADGNTAIVGGCSDNGSVGAAWAFARTSLIFSVAAPSSTTAGVPFNFTVTARDADNAIATNYTGVVHFSSSDALAVLPANSLLTNGAGTFTATLKSGNFVSQTITATDTVNPLITGTSSSIGVQSAALAHLVVSGPASATAGVPFLFTLAGTDAFGNFAPPFGRVVRITSTDATALLPPESPTSIAFSAVLNGLGNHTITLTDTAIPSISGTTNTIPVLGNPATNLARGKTATQSSTLSGYATASAAAAVDDFTNGNFFAGSVTHTNLETNPWWQVDLGASFPVTSIVIWNRTDCCSARLNDYWVFVSDTPFGPADTPSTLQNRAGTWSSYQTTAPNASSTIPAGNMQGRYVRVQLAGANYLSLAEVQVLFRPVADWNLAAGKPAAQSSTYPGSATGAGAAVDGSTDGRFPNGSVTHTNLDLEPWWQVDLGVATLVDSVVIHNRTDCCGSRLSDYYIFVSDIPFSQTDTIATLLGRPGLAVHQTAAPNPAAPVFVGGFGRYVRVQVPGRNYLSLAEVQVAGAANVAQGKAATQSSTLAGYPTAGAASAVDGSTLGYFTIGSVTHTDLERNAWWQVDLGTSVNIRAVEIYNRTDCCGSRLQDYWVFGSDTPFAPSDTPLTLENRPGTWHFQMGTAPNPNAGFFPGEVTSRYIRVQLAGTGYLSLAEALVLGTPRAFQ